MAIFPGGLALDMSKFWILLEQIMMGGEDREVAVTTGDIKRTKLQFKSSPPANQHPTYAARRDVAE